MQDFYGYFRMGINSVLQPFSSSTQQVTSHSGSPLIRLPFSQFLRSSTTMQSRYVASSIQRVFVQPLITVTRRSVVRFVTTSSSVFLTWLSLVRRRLQKATLQCVSRVVASRLSCQWQSSHSASTTRLQSSSQLPISSQKTRPEGN